MPNSPASCRPHSRCGSPSGLVSDSRPTDMRFSHQDASQIAGVSSLERSLHFAERRAERAADADLDSERIGLDQLDRLLAGEQLLKVGDCLKRLRERLLAG